MFGLISTKNLYIIEISTYMGVKYQYYPSYNFSFVFSDEKRYALGRKSEFSNYRDIFTSTTYETKEYVTEGEECVTQASTIITNKKYITVEEATMILQDLNSTYISDNEKILSKKK